MTGTKFDMRRRRSESSRAKGRMTLARSDVVAAGAQLLDEIGVGGISMRKLAAALGTGPATLYWHVRDKDELLLLILDDTVKDIEIPTRGSWDKKLRTTLFAGREALSSRPALVKVLWGAAWALGPATLRYADAVVGFVAESGLPEKEIGDAYFALLILLFGFVESGSSSPGNVSFREVAATQASDDPDADDPATLYPNLVRHGPGAGLDAMERRFAYALERVIEGIKVRAQQPVPDGKR